MPKQHRAAQWPYRWDLLLRYRFIEIIALWEGRLTTRHLCGTFGIGRQQASKDINTYLREVGPGNLLYDKHLKGYIPAISFRPAVTRGVAEEYLSLLARHSEMTQLFGALSLDAAGTELLQLPLRNVQPAVLRALTQAARQQRRLEVDYVSLNNPDREGRIIVPHTLVFTGLRWHVRAWCEKNRDYRDFVLSRFRDEPELMDRSPHGSDGDAAWNTSVMLRIAPDPRLREEQREVVASDYGMTDGTLEIPLRGTLVPYALKLLHIDPDKEATEPLAQQIVVTNRKEIEEWLFA